MEDPTLCILGCGNLGTSILRGLLNAYNDPGSNVVRFHRIIACVRSNKSRDRVNELLSDEEKSMTFVAASSDYVGIVRKSNVIILAVDPSDVDATLSKPRLSVELKGKLLISVVAGWSRGALEKLVSTGGPSEEASRVWVLRTLPNIAAQVSQSLTAIEDPGPGFPTKYMEIAESIFSQIGKTVHIAPRLMNATTAVAGSTPAFWAVICDAFIDAAVAVGMPRAIAQAQIYQSMRGTAEMLQSGVHPGMLKDQGTSPEGCTIGGLMVMEEAGVRGSLGKALREAVTIARLMGSGEKDLHVNDTGQS